MKSRGFALLEVLVSVAIFAVIAVIIYRSIASVSATTAAITEKSERLRAVQLTVALLDRDLRQSAARPIRAGYGETLPALSGARGAVEFSAFGFGSAADATRPALARIGYVIREGRLERLSWPTLDRAPATLAIRRPLLENVERIEFRFLDGADRWGDQWPPASDGNGQPQRLPRAVEFRLHLSDFGELRRVIELPESLPPRVAG